MRKILLLLLVLGIPLCPYAQKRHQAGSVKSKVTVKRAASSSKGKGTSSRSGKRTVTFSNASIRGLQGQRAAIQKKIREQERALRANQTDVKQRLQNLLVINSEIDQSQRKIEGIQKDITHINGNIGILKNQLHTLEQQLRDRKAKYISSMRYMARHHSVEDKLMFIFSAKNFAQMYRRLQFIRQYASYQRAQGEIVKAKQRQVYAKHRQLEQVKGHKNTLLYKGQVERGNLQARQSDQQQVVESLKKQQKTIQSIISEQHKKDAALNAQIDRLVAQQVAQARARAAAEAKKKAAAVAAAKRRAEILAQKKAAAEAAARENARRIAEAKAREAQMKAAAEAAAKAEAAAREAQAKVAQQKAAQAAAAQATQAAAARKAQADQAMREAEADRVAAERKAQAEAVRNKREIAEAKQQAQDAVNLTTVDRMMSNGFEANRGRLPMPITGTYRIVSHFGQYQVEGLSGVTLDNKGINILGKPGCMARAIYDGEVSSVFSYGGTIVVMVRHGAYISVYCNLKSVAVHKGQKVHTGQALGGVGADNILQFQLRKETAKLNPESWLSR